MRRQAAGQREQTEEQIADQAIVAQLVSMGFSENAATRAAIGVKNVGIDAATNWIMEHIEDPGINDRLSKPQAYKGRGWGAVGGDVVDPEMIVVLSSMGFPEANVRTALQAC